MTRTLHAVELYGIGGVERVFSAFLAHPEASCKRENHVLLGSRAVHLDLRPIIGAGADSVQNCRTWNGIRVPRVLRRSHLARCIRRTRADRVILWNWFGDRRVSEANPDVPVIYYEHGGGWLHSGLKGEAERFLNALCGVVCNSHAAERHLRLRFDWRGPSILCFYGLRPEMRPSSPQVKALPTSRPVRLGVAGRLIPLKGVSLALHTLRTLRKEDREVELHLAGTGPEEARLRNHAAALGIDKHVIFHGLVHDMASFYQFVDVFLCPSLREPFGLVSIEAAAWGCPVIAAKVDGLPETMVSGETGVAIAPTLPLDAYPEVGGTLNGVPAIVYDPDADLLREPKLLDPEKVADELRVLLDSPGRFEAMSRAASEHVIRTFDFDRYMRSVIEAFDTLAKSSG